MPHKKNILYIVPSSGYGGAETFLIHTAKFHNKNIFSLSYLFFRNGPLVDTIRNLGIEVSVLASAPRLRNPISIFIAIYKISKLIKSKNINLVHSTMAYGALFGALAAACAKKPHIWFQHGPISGWMDRIASYLPTKYIFVNSKYTEQKQKEITQKNPIQIIKLGVDLEKIERLKPSSQERKEIRARWGVEENCFLVGIACRAQAQKGIELFLSAVHSASKHSSKIQAIIIGFSSDKISNLKGYEKTIVDYANSLDLALKIQIAKNDIYKELNALDLLISSSVKPEAFGLTLIEAMAVGTPVLSAKEGGPLDIIREGINGFFFESRNKQDLADKIKMISELPEPDRMNLSANSVRDVELIFQAKECIKSIENIYDKVLN